eukprot:Em0010g8a
MRNTTGRHSTLKKLRTELDEQVINPPCPASELFLAGQKLLFIYQPTIDAQRLYVFCQAVLVGMETLEVKPGQPRDDASVTTCLNMILILTDYTLWKFTARAGDAIKLTLHKLCASFVHHLVDNGLFQTLNTLSSDMDGKWTKEKESLHQRYQELKPHLSEANSHRVEQDMLGLK